MQWKKWTVRFHWRNNFINCCVKALWHCTGSQTVGKVSWVDFSQSSILSYEGKSLRYSKPPYRVKTCLFSVRWVPRPFPARLFACFFWPSDCSASQEYHPGWVWGQTASPLLCVLLKRPGTELREWRTDSYGQGRKWGVERRSWGTQTLQTLQIQENWT